MPPVSLKSLPPWALYGGAGVAVGGGYLLYRKRKAVAGATTPVPVGTNVVDTSGTQQPSVVPYYLTADPNNTASGPRPVPPLPVPTTIIGGGVGGATGTDSGTPGGTLPPIPPILPSSPVPSTAGPTPAPTPQVPAAPPAQNNNLPADLLAKISANGEKIVSSLSSPNGGVWYLGDKGGVFAINAPFYGSPAGQSYWGSRRGLQLVPSGNGYTVVASSGERYAYG